MEDNAGFELGTTSLMQELDTFELTTEGEVPEWLRGTLLRVGPACFELNGSHYRHWFDGLAMLHRFHFIGGGVTYRNRFLRSRTYRDNMKANAIRHGEFATSPSRSWPGRLKTLVFPDLSDNANVAVAPLGGEMTAMTETPTPLAFNLDTLAAIGPVKFADKIPGMITTAHPHFDFASQELLNYTTAFGRQSRYNIYRLHPGKRRRELIASLPVKRPGYMHSFGATPRYVILTEWPLTVNPLDLKLSGMTGRPFIDNFRWGLGQESRLLVVRRSTGKLAHEARGPCGFAFHHVNAWEEGDAIVMDLCLYDDARIIDQLRLGHMRNRQAHYARPRLSRLRINANGSVDVSQPADAVLELPGINYRRGHMRPNRYIYGVTTEGARILLGGLVKADTETADLRYWRAPHCYPGEPVFTPMPDSEAEDGGVVMSLVLDGAKRSSFLLLLDAERFEELARVHLPHAVPFGFHGVFLGYWRPDL